NYNSKLYLMFGQSSEVQAVCNNQKEKEILNTLVEIDEEENIDGNNDESNIEEEDIKFSNIPISENVEQTNKAIPIGMTPYCIICPNITDVILISYFQDIEKALGCNGDKNVTNRFLLAAYKKQSRLTFAKCQAIWNKQNRSSQMTDIVKTNLDVYLKTPNDTCWNSWFDAIKFLIIHFKISPFKFYKVCDAFTVNRFSKTDIEFLDEYLLVMEPLCVCLDVLQGEKHMYFGYLLPSITSLKQG
ncbi:Uncharacterized protein FWK35_00034993, partial [Aphis craccivora]